MHIVKQLTQGVEISVQTRFLPSESSIRHGHYFFMYDITIENKNEFSVQLLSRHWHIFDSNGEYREVKGEGVVGEQPFIEPGQKYNYRSGCNLATEIGKMQGSYKMIRLIDNKEFYAQIPEFNFVLPAKLN
ncbi:MAG: Co2+/Mg2+ efflux protein ApaG [Bacteroidia bacterium]